MNDTIFALATAPGRGAIAVVRLFGPDASRVLRALAGPPPPARRAVLRTLRDAGGAPLDQALVLRFDAPESFTGEDGAELHLHGGQAVVDGVTRALAAAGARLAAPGEFTRRAFENGKLDLAQAESIADLVDAETASQARQALEQLGGGLSRRYDAWRAALIEGLAFLEAAIDFPDEETPADVAERAGAYLTLLRDQLAAALEDAGRGRQVRDGYRVAVLGAPNAGKSSLVNRLAGREAAIVDVRPGTTRDIIEIPLVIGGYKIILGDAAGLRDTADAVEAEGVRRARAWAEDAALRLWIVDRAAGDGAWRAAANFVREGDLCLLNKADLAPGSDAAEAGAHAGAHGLRVLEVSAAGGSMSEVDGVLEGRLAHDLSGADFPAATRLRHQRLLADCVDHLDRALGRPRAPELAAEDVRLAARALERVTGAVGPEDVLERVFANFCIGK